MTKSPLDLLDEAERAATPGEWFDVGDGCGTPCIATNDWKEHSHEAGYWIAYGLNDETNNPSMAPEQNRNFHLIALMRNNIRALIDIARAAEPFIDDKPQFIGPETVRQLKEAFSKLKVSDSKLNGGDKWEKGTKNPHLYV